MTNTHNTFPEPNNQISTFALSKSLWIQPPLFPLPERAIFIGYEQLTIPLESPAPAGIQLPLIPQEAA